MKDTVNGNAIISTDPDSEYTWILVSTKIATESTSSKRTNSAAITGFGKENLRISTLFRNQNTDVPLIVKDAPGGAGDDISDIKVSDSGYHNDWYWKSKSAGWSLFIFEPEMNLVTLLKFL